MPLPGPNEAMLYNGTIDCAKKTITREGIRGLYKGWWIVCTLNMYKYILLILSSY